MTKKCFYCGDVLAEGHFLLDKATMIMPETYAHRDCIDSLGDGSLTVTKCHYCGKPATQLEFDTNKATRIGRNRYAHIDCIASHGKENTMDEQTQHILGAADSTHQGIGLAISLLQESLGNIGEILTQGNAVLGPASLGSTMRLGQCIKETAFLLADLQGDAHGLCVLLGKDLGVCEDKTNVIDTGPPRPSARSGYPEEMFGHTLGDVIGEPLGTPDHRDLVDVLDSEDLEPGEDEFDDDDCPF